MSAAYPYSISELAAENELYTRREILEAVKRLEYEANNKIYTLVCGRYMVSEEGKDLVAKLLNFGKDPYSRIMIQGTSYHDAFRRMFAPKEVLHSV